MTNKLCAWFDITVTDMDKAAHFYKNVLGHELKIQTQNNITTAVFEHQKGEDLGGSLILNPKHQATSATGGPLLYFSVEGRLAQAVAEVSKCGGKVLAPVEEIAPRGFRSIVTDCCGNKIALHSYKK